MEDINTSNANKAAFPSTDGRTFANDGLTKREYFASQILNAHIVSMGYSGGYSHAVKVSIDVADELLKQLDLTNINDKK